MKKDIDFDEKCKNLNHFFDILNELEKNGFDISNDKIELVADVYSGSWFLQFVVESKNSDDKIKVLTIVVGKHNPHLLEKNADCDVDMYGEYFNGDDFDEIHHLKQEDLPKLVKWLNESINDTSPDEVLKHFEKEGLDV